MLLLYSDATLIVVCYSYSRMQYGARAKKPWTTFGVPAGTFFPPKKVTLAPKVHGIHSILENSSDFVSIFMGANFKSCHFTRHFEGHVAKSMVKTDRGTPRNAAPVLVSERVLFHMVVRTLSC